MSADLTRREFERVSPAGRYIHTHFGIGYRSVKAPALRTHDDEVPRTEAVGA